MTEAEKLARQLCLEAMVRIGEEEFRRGNVPPDQVGPAAAATLRAVERMWRDWLPDAEAILAERGRR